MSGNTTTDAYSHDDLPEDPRAQKVIARLERALAEAKAQVEVGLELSGSFFEALKPLNLQAIDVANPGRHVTDLISQLAEVTAERNAAKSDIRKLLDLIKVRGARHTALREAVAPVKKQVDKWLTADPAWSDLEWFYLKVPKTQAVALAQAYDTEGENKEEANGLSM